MIQAFVICLREGFESFLIVAIILAYVQRSGRPWLKPAIYWGILVSLLLSGVLGLVLLESARQSLWEGILGVVTVVMVGTLIIQMWLTGPTMKKEMESKLSKLSIRPSRAAAIWGGFVFTIVMVTREGIETAMMLIQVRNNGQFVGGILAGLFSAAVLSFTWTRVSHLINLKRFFQVTGIFLLLFLLQIGIYSVHEFSEAGILPRSEAIHVATEKFSPVGLYGKWFSLLIVVTCALWLALTWAGERIRLAAKKA